MSSQQNKKYLVVGASFSIALYKYNSNVKDLLFYYIY